jgi:hypothetical protein
VEQQIARIQEDGVLNLSPYPFDVCRFPGQTAKLIGFSPTGLGLAEQVVAVDDGEISRRGRVAPTIGDAEEDKKDRDKDHGVPQWCQSHNDSPQ